MTRHEWRDRGPLVDKLPGKKLPEGLVAKTKQNLDSESAKMLTHFQGLVQESDETTERAREVEKKVSRIIE